jgi:hypothetical protein
VSSERTATDGGAGTAPAELSAELAVEQQYVDRVHSRLAELRRTAAEVEKAGYSIAKVGTFGAYVERDAMVYHAARRRLALDAEYEGLVFGRLDMGPDARPPEGEPASAPVEPAVPGGEVRYIGRLGLRDEGYEPLVVDWRAPAAAPFYRATPTDRMDVVRRRTIRSSGDKVIGVEDDLLDPDAAPASMAVIGDGALLAALTRATGRGMRDIVATIQREQDDAIRSPASGVTVVRGGPGTGKTAVALHRAAYLLYNDRNRFESGGVLVVGPSEVFVGYVARVLPSLGEDAVTLRSLGQLLPGVSADRHDPADLAAAKGSVRMVRLLTRAARDDAPDAPGRLRLLYKGQLLSLDQRVLDEARREVMGGGARRNAVRPKAAGWILDALWRQTEELFSKVSRPARAEFAQEIAERPEFRAFMSAWWPRLRPLDVLGWLRDPARVRRYAEGVFGAAQIDVLVRGFARFDPDALRVEDVALLDELNELLGEPKVASRPRKDPFHVIDGVHELATRSEREAAARRVATERPEDYREYAHIVVDEAQDVSPMQWRMIGRRGEFASWTIVGDPAQAAWPDPAESARAMTEAVGRRRREFELTTNYRNAAEIFDVAAAVIRRAEPDIALPTAVRQAGVRPRHLTVPAVSLADATREAVLDILGDVEGTVGVIASTATRDRVAASLDGVAEARLQVVTGLDAKGMEYDGVVVVEPAELAAEGTSGVRTLYVALSRATQRLTTVGTDASWQPS